MKGFVGFNLIGELCVVISSELCYSVTGSSMVSLQYRGHTTNYDPYRRNRPEEGCFLAVKSPSRHTFRIHDAPEGSRVVEVKGLWKVLAGASGVSAFRASGLQGQ